MNHHSTSQHGVNSPLRSITSGRVATRVGHGSIAGMSTKSLIGATRLLKVDNQRVLQNAVDTWSWVRVMRQQWTHKINLQRKSPQQLHQYQKVKGCV